MMSKKSESEPSRLMHNLLPDIHLSTTEMNCGGNPNVRKQSAIKWWCTESKAFFQSMLTRKALTGSGFDSALSSLLQYSKILAVVSEMLTDRK